MWQSEKKRRETPTKAPSSKKQGLHKRKWEAQRGRPRVGERKEQERRYFIVVGRLSHHREGENNGGDQFERAVPGKGKGDRKRRAMRGCGKSSEPLKGKKHARRRRGAVPKEGVAALAPREEVSEKNVVRWLKSRTDKENIQETLQAEKTGVPRKGRLQLGGG